MPNSVTRVVINRGEARAVYSDGMAPYLQPLRAHVQRASHVEPDNEHRHGGNWCIDFSPIGGAMCYVDNDGKPFLTREEALAYEKQLVERFWVDREQCVL